MEHDEKVRLVRCRDENPKGTSYVDVIFVHGLTGDHKATWSSDEHDKETFWPSALEQQRKPRVWSLNHDAPLLRISDQNSVEMNLGTDAPAILGKFEQQEIGSNPIVFVTHSLGGLLVKALLRSAEGEKAESRHRIASNTRAVIFLAVPHCGSSLANIAKLSPAAVRTASGLALSILGTLLTLKFLLVNLLGWLVRPGRSLQQLPYGSANLRELGWWYRNFAERNDVETLTFYETKRLYGSIVVTPCSADPGIANSTPEAIAKNHVEICKLPKPVEESSLFGRVRDSVLKVHERNERGARRSVFEDRLQANLKNVLADPELNLLRVKRGNSAGEGNPRYALPRKFGDIPTESNLRGKFELALRKSLRSSLRSGMLVLDYSDVAAAERSCFELDKYVLDLWREEDLIKSFKAMRERFEDEAKTVAIHTESLYPLYRPARALEHAMLDDLPNLLNAIQGVIPAIEKQPHLDAGRHTRKLLERMGKSLAACYATHVDVRKQQQSQENN